MPTQTIDGIFVFFKLNDACASLERGSTVTGKPQAVHVRAYLRIPYSDLLFSASEELCVIRRPCQGADVVVVALQHPLEGAFTVRWVSCFGLTQPEISLLLALGHEYSRCAIGSPSCPYWRTPEWSRSDSIVFARLRPCVLREYGLW